MSFDILPGQKPSGFLPLGFAVLFLRTGRATWGGKRHDPPTAKETAMGPNYRPGGRILFALRLRCMPRRASSHASGTNLHYSALAKTRGSRTPRSAHGPRHRVRTSMIPRLS